MADECTDVATIEELAICCCWVESGAPEEYFIEIFPLKKANAEGIYYALVEYCREKNIQLARLKRTGFDGAATFSGDKTGAQGRFLLLKICLKHHMKSTTLHEITLFCSMLCPFIPHLLV